MKTSLLFTLLFIGSTLFGQSILFTEDFESGGLGQFTAGNTLNTITWQTTTNRGSDPGHSASNSAYFGNPSSFNYDSGEHEWATLTSSAINIAGQSNLFLSFNYFLETQNANSFDMAFVQVSTNGTDFYTVADNGIQGGLSETNGIWKNIVIDIKQLLTGGATTVYIRFVFNTVDGNTNNFEGFYVDDVIVRTKSNESYSKVAYADNIKEKTIIASTKLQNGEIIESFNYLDVNNGNTIFGLVKVNPLDGSQVWRKIINDTYVQGTPIISDNVINGITELNNGNIAFVGSGKVFSIKTPYFGIINSGGTNIITTQALKNSLNKGIDGEYNDVAQLNNNNIIMVGVAFDTLDVSSPSDPWGASNGPSYQPLLTLISPTGNVIWSKICRMHNIRSTEFTEVKPTSDGGFLVLGNANPNYYNYKHSYIAKYNQNGTLIWRKNYLPGYDLKGLQVKANNSIYLFAEGNNQILVLSLDSQGNGNQVGNFSMYTNGLTRTVKSANLTNDGGVVVTGIIEHLLKDSCIFSFKLSNANNLEWMSIFGGDATDVSVGVHQVSDGGYYISAYTNSFNSFNRFQDYHIKIDSLGTGKACFVNMDFGNYYANSSALLYTDYTDSLMYETPSYMPTINYISSLNPLVFSFYDNYPIVNSVSVPLNCYNDLGQVTLNVSSSPAGGTGPYTYYWSNGSSSSILSNVPSNLYVYEVTDANGCMVKDSAILLQPLPISTNLDVTNPLCNGGFDGAIDLTVFGGVGNYTYHWANTQTTEDLNGIQAGFYHVTVLDANSCSVSANTSVIEPTAINLGISSTTQVSCNGLCDGSISTVVSGGTTPYTYSWNDPLNQTTPTASNLCPNNYLLTLTDANNCVAYGNAIITEPDPIQYTFTTTGSECGLDNGSAQVQVTGGVAPYIFNWSTGATGNSVTGLAAGNYGLSGQDANGCSHTGTFMIEPLTNGVPICIITVDSSSQHNVVVWEKPVSTTIAGFKIYRNVTGAYNEVGYVPYSSLSQFKDNTFGVNPNTTSYRYKISVVDTCGYESDLSSYHETIHVTSSVGLGGEVNLIWDNYEGFGFTNYLILKDTTDNGVDDFYEADQVSSISFTWTDQNPQNFVNYVIEVISPTTCTSTKANDWNSTRSNKTSKTSSFNGIAVNDIDEASLIIYPNPNNGQFTVAYYSLNTQPVNYEIYDYTGKLIISNTVSPSLGDNQLNIDLNDVSNGVYSIRIVSGSSVINKQFIINK